MTCQKCASSNVLRAEEEAPPWAKSWMKCFTCGKRWDAGGQAPKPQDEDENDEELDEPESDQAPRSSDDLVSLVMRVAKDAAPVKKKEPTTMTRPRCTKKSCPDESAEDSVRCPKHRDMQRAQNAKYLGRALTSPTRTYTKKSTTEAMPTHHTTMPVPARRVDLNGNALTLMDRAITSLEIELATLKSAREIMVKRA